MITVEINDVQITRAFQQLESALTDMTQPMRDIGEVLVISTKDRMRDGQSPDGTPFAARSPVTLRAYEKRKQKYGPKPLWLIALAALSTRTPILLIAARSRWLALPAG